jgi:hypothetical protein
LVPELITILEKTSVNLGKDVHVTSGKRDGDVSASAHNSGIAADVSVEGMKSVAIADQLVTEGFTGVGEYYEADGQTERSFAHGDIRGLDGSGNSGAYAAGGAKSAPACWTGKGDPPDYSPGRQSGHDCP